MWWVAVAWGSECEGLEPRLACACEEQRVRSVNGSLAGASTGVHKLTEPAWRSAAASTCAWVDAFGTTDDDDRCVQTTTCVRLLAEDRLATVSASAPGARAADLLRVTGRRCPEGDKGCATDARTAEEERLAAVVSALQRLRLAPVDAQRDWHVYRDGSCDAEAVSGEEDKVPWARAACGAVLAARRADVLAALGALHDPAAAAAIEEARWRAAYGRLRPRSRPWEDWLEEVRGDAEIRGLIREMVEARVDGALFPPLVSTHGFGKCVDPTALSCIEAVRAEVRALREETPETRAEAAWREAWCGHRETVGERVACDAEVDFIVAAAH
jgi:hypothetical protein